MNSVSSNESTVRNLRKLQKKVSSMVIQVVGRYSEMPTIDSDSHVVETEHTWDFMDRADQKYRPLIVRPRGEGGGEYWFVDGKIRGLARIVMTAQQLAEVSERTGRVMDTPRETREMENGPAQLQHLGGVGIELPATL